MFAILLYVRFLSCVYSVFIYLDGKDSAFNCESHGTLTVIIFGVKYFGSGASLTTGNGRLLILLSLTQDFLLLGIFDLVFFAQR